jgi:hypothetical protein
MKTKKLTAGKYGPGHDTGNMEVAIQRRAIALKRQNPWMSKALAEAVTRYGVPSWNFVPTGGAVLVFDLVFNANDDRQNGRCVVVDIDPAVSESLTGRGAGVGTVIRSKPFAGFPVGTGLRLIVPSDIVGSESMYDDRCKT